MNELPRALVGWCEARVGATLCEKWKLDGLIDVGGMAAVYSATHRNGNRVAIKVLHPDAALVPGVRERFLKEGYVANHISHAGAVRVLDDDVADDGAVFLVMELLEGETLQTRIGRKGGRLAPDDVLCVIDRVLDVLCAAHEKDILHRDIKPANIFITLGGEVKLLDFGIARVREEIMGIPNCTIPGMVLGTPGFLPPEQALGRVDDVDARSDLWAVGATMFAALVGRAVHEAETTNEQLVLAATQPAPSLGTAAPRAPKPLVLVVDRALGHRREERWQSAAEMRAAVRAAFHEIEGFRISGAAPGAVVDPAVKIESRTDPVFLSDEGTQPRGTGKERWLPPPTDPRHAPVRSLTLHGSVTSTALRVPFGTPLSRGARLLRSPAVPLAAAAAICLFAVLGALLRAGPTAEAETRAAVPLSDVAVPPPALSASPAPQSRPPAPPRPPGPAQSSAPAPPAPTPPGVAASRKPAPRTGTLNIRSIPASQVFLDGKSLGSTPKVNVKVSPGIHQVAFVHSLFPRKTLTLYIPEGGTKTASVRLEQTRPPKK